VAVFAFGATLGASASRLAFLRFASLSAFAALGGGSGLLKVSEEEVEGRRGRKGAVARRPNRWSEG
jgi:hypothetical protein